MTIDSGPNTAAGIGHNQGPPLSMAGSWAGYCWTRARRDVWDNPPVEVVRLRARRARELGLTYKQYAGILLDRGVRTEAVILDLTALPAPATPLERIAAKLRDLRNCRVFAAAEADGGSPLGAGELIAALNERAGGIVSDWVAYPALAAAGGLGARRRPAMPAARLVLPPVLALLRRHLIAPSAAFMVGDGPRAARIAETARLARVFPAAAYFR